MCVSKPTHTLEICISINLTFVAQYVCVCKRERGREGERERERGEREREREVDQVSMIL